MITHSEKLFVLLWVLFGFSVAVSLAPKDAYFLPNFAFFWLPQLVLLIIAHLCKLRPAMIAGVAFALASHLAVFAIWLRSREHPDSMAWLGYMFSLPGAGIGLLTSIYWSKKWPALKPLSALATAATTVLGCIIFNQTIICNTLMYCSGQ